jgi:small subunit ribosomal protein S5
VVAGGTVRAILEIAGVSDCLTKCYGSTNARNVVKAVFDGLERLRTPEQVMALRGVTLDRTIIAEKIEKGRANLPSARAGEQRAKGPVNIVGQDRRGPGRGGSRGRRRREGGEGPAAEGGAPPAEGAPKA